MGLVAHVEGGCFIPVEDNLGLICGAILEGKVSPNDWRVSLGLNVGLVELGDFGLEPLTEGVVD